MSVKKIDQKNRIIEHPNRYKLENVVGESNTYDLTKVTGEVIEEGTPFNKTYGDIIDDNFKKIINQINYTGKYNKITGEKNNTTNTSTFNYTLDILDEDDLEDNTIIKVDVQNEVQKDLENLNIVKSATSIGTSYYLTNLIEMSNKNIMIAGSGSTSSCYITIVDSKGNIVKSSTSMGNYLYSPYLIELDNGNIMIVGRTSSSSYIGYIAIVDKGGNTVKAATSTSAYCTIPIKMSNGYIMIADNIPSGTSSGQGYIIIVDENGNIIKSATLIASNFYTTLSLVELDNSNIMILGRSSSSPYRGNIVILDQSGNIIKSSTSIVISVYYSTPLIKMTNGNVMICGANSSGEGYITIIDEEGNIVKEGTSIGTHFTIPKAVELNNGNIMIIGRTSGTTYDCYITIIDEEGNIIKEETTIGTYATMNIQKLNNGDVMICGTYASGQSYITIIDEDGNIVKEETGIGRYFISPKLLKLSDGNIFIAGVDSSSTYTGYISIVEPEFEDVEITLNNIKIDNEEIELEKNKYYELIYNEEDNKFKVKNI